MLLLDTQTLRVKTFIGQQTPRYAILSHTWGDDELSLQALQSGGAEHTNGYVKVSKFCRIARENGHRYAWVDTCCIDKTSSAELSEAINSMFQWYRKAAVCYTYLSDLDPGDSHQLQTALPDCRWFKRGWTLQELLAPKELHFYDSEWNERGTKAGLITSLSNITATRISALENADELYCLPAAEKMSWASRRTTTRAEDMAYCLLGILDVQMGLLYGEGPKAFRRLQEEVMRKTNDMSLLAWIPVTAGDEMREIWARSPVEFSWIVEQAVQLDVTSQWNTELDITSKGLRLSTVLLVEPDQCDGGPRISEPPFHTDVLDLGCNFSNYLKATSIGIRLRKFGPFLYVRDVDGPLAAQLVTYDPEYVARYSRTSARHRRETIWLQTEDKCFPYWIARRPQNLPQMRFYREFRNYDPQAGGHTRDLHFPSNQHFLEPPRAIRGEVWNCANRTYMAGWDTTRRWEAVVLHVSHYTGTDRILFVCVEARMRGLGLMCFLVEEGDPLGQRMLNADHRDRHTCTGNQEDERDLEDSMIRRYWQGRETEENLRTLRGKVSATISTGIVPSISTSRELSIVTFHLS